MGRKNTDIFIACLGILHWVILATQGAIVVNTNASSMDAIETVSATATTTFSLVETTMIPTSTTITANTTATTTTLTTAVTTATTATTITATTATATTTTTSTITTTTATVTTTISTATTATITIVSTSTVTTTTATTTSATTATITTTATTVITTSSTTRLALPSVQAVHANSCLPGTEIIPNSIVCSDAAATLNKRFKGTEDTSFHPKGCFVSGSSLVFFNDHEVGGASWKTRPICIAQADSIPLDGVWVLIHMDSHCSSGVRKGLAESGASLARCQSLTRADPECGNQMYSNGDMCRCVRVGLVCDFRETDTGNNVYELQKPGPRTTIAPTTTTWTPTSGTTVTVTPDETTLSSIRTTEQQSSTTDFAVSLVVNATSFQWNSQVLGLIKLSVVDPAGFVDDPGAQLAVLRLLMLVTQQAADAIDSKITMGGRRIESLQRSDVRRLQGVVYIRYSVYVEDEVDAGYIAMNLKDMESLQFVLRQKLEAVGYAHAENVKITEVSSEFVVNGYGIVSAMCCGMMSPSTMIAALLLFAALLRS